MKLLADLPKKYNANLSELTWVESWSDDNLYAYDPSVSRDNTFVIDTPPPTVSLRVRTQRARTTFSPFGTLVISEDKRLSTIHSLVGFDSNNFKHKLPLHI